MSDDAQPKVLTQRRGPARRSGAKAISDCGAHGDRRRQRFPFGIATRHTGSSSLQPVELIRCVSCVIGDEGDAMALRRGTRRIRLDVMITIAGMTITAAAG